MNDFLEIGYWRQRDVRVERVLAVAEELLAATPEDELELELRLVAAVRSVREFDAANCPWQRRVLATG